MPLILSNDHSRADRYAPISLSVSDHRPLQILALESPPSGPLSGGALLFEIDRADVVEDTFIHRRVVGLDDVVECRDRGAGERHIVGLVDHVRQNAEGASMSVGSSCGAAMVEFRVGRSILWPDRHGEERTYTVHEVRWGRTEAYKT